MESYRLLADILASPIIFAPLGHNFQDFCLRYVDEKWIRQYVEFDDNLDI